MKDITRDRKLRRVRRVRGVIFGTSDIPRISVYRSNRYIFVQAIDDKLRKTIVQASSFSIKSKKADTKVGKKSDDASIVGKKLAELLLKKGIKKGVFDRGSYAYLGRVKSLAEGLREGGLTV